MTITTITRVLIFGWLILSLSACAAAPRTSSYGYAELAATAAPAQPPMPAEGAAPATQPRASGATTDPVAQPRLIIRTADITLVVKDTQETLDLLTRLSAELGGFVVSSSTSRAGRAIQGYITLRVDATRFDEAMNRIRAAAIEVRSESVRGEDVTAEYVDLDARLKNLEAAEAQLQQILKQATATEDVLAVYRELTQIRSQIEQIKGRMKYLSQSAVLATISVTLIPDALAQPVEVGGWRPEGVVREAVEALIAALQGLASVLIWLIIVGLPMLVIIALPFIAVFAILRRARRNKRKATAES